MDRFTALFVRRGRGGAGTSALSILLMNVYWAQQNLTTIKLKLSLSTLFTSPLTIFMHAFCYLLHAVVTGHFIITHINHSRTRMISYFFLLISFSHLSGSTSTDIMCWYCGCWCCCCCCCCCCNCWCWWCWCWCSALSRSLSFLDFPFLCLIRFSITRWAVIGGQLVTWPRGSSLIFHCSVPLQAPCLHLHLLKIFDTFNINIQQYWREQDRKERCCASFNIVWIVSIIACSSVGSALSPAQHSVQVQLRVPSWPV